jgi:hypothetical protein
MRIEDKVQNLKRSKASQLEFVRIANEMRIIHKSDDQTHKKTKSLAQNESTKKID